MSVQFRDVLAGLLKFGPNGPVRDGLDCPYCGSYETCWSTQQEPRWGHLANCEYWAAWTLGVECGLVEPRE